MLSCSLSAALSCLTLLLFSDLAGAGLRLTASRDALRDEAEAFAAGALAAGVEVVQVAAQGSHLAAQLFDAGARERAAGAVRRRLGQ